jgi:hypothetical protein
VFKAMCVGSSLTRTIVSCIFPFPLSFRFGFAGAVGMAGSEGTGEELERDDVVGRSTSMMSESISIGSSAMAVPSLMAGGSATGGGSLWWRADAR